MSKITATAAVVQVIETGRTRVPDNVSDAMNTGSAPGNTGASETNPKNPLVRKDPTVSEIREEDKDLAAGEPSDVRDGVGNSGGEGTSTSPSSGSGQGGSAVSGTGQ